MSARRRTTSAGPDRTLGATSDEVGQRTAGYRVETGCDARCDHGPPRGRADNSATDPDGRNDTCVVGDPGSSNTDAMESAPQSMVFLYDGTTCPVD